ncbi:hypothetical protein IMG5_016400 [Ichthyophthirius multifiliis]|uniref:Guanylate cyclase domain-containing protein n=1 Tax=Ichthyophthirius multifiliis TaxID=5932 RepID=G0QKD6_ICHMU|nr:hypothetical protein IMG5_016400 [Ichthyophthirius multifiliis]EGR34324.1 hypothetical protein IMG5_016400 [Ichthyophthirius multifiliis]|eukprot:XP_004039628.1 hypothetical protein IMG5_016400 [Ichthyophthirius multifiliis]
MLFRDLEADLQKVQKFPLIKNILNSTFYAIFINIVTIFALFGDDIRVIATNKKADNIFDGITITVQIIYVIEIILTTLTKRNYALSFFFGQILFQRFLQFQIYKQQIKHFFLVQVLMQHNQQKQEKLLEQPQELEELQDYQEQLEQLNYINLLLYNLNKIQIKSKSFYKKEEKKKKSYQNKEEEVKLPLNLKFKLKKIIFIILLVKQHLVIQQIQKIKINIKMQIYIKYIQFIYIFLIKKDFVSLKESQVSRILSNLITKRVIIIVLILLFIMPLFSADYYFDLPISMDLVTQQLKMIIETQSTKDQIINQYQDIIIQYKNLSSPLAYFQVPLTYLSLYQSDFEILRNDEKEGIGYKLEISKFAQNHPDQLDEINYLNRIQDEDQLLIQGFLNVSSQQVLNSGLSIGRTIFVCLVLTIGAVLFSKDTNDLALGPIERMRDKVIKISKNPLASKELELIQEEEGKHQYETIIIENAIIKIGMLLALGFGDAGSGIIAYNMSKSGDVDPMIAGKKKCAIYGFCDIRNFTDATEVLQEDVMIFVNNIAEIVHSMVDRYLGAANKNIGDAFLLVWKIQEDKYTINENDNTIIYNNIQYINIFADFSVISFLKIQVKINREQKILAYRRDQRLNKRIENYKVKMGFGLHIGWAIEGAIGSQFKIDASYLSPNVNMASRLETATKQYGVPLLISSDLYDVFSDTMQILARNIDKVTVKGSTRPIGLYTIDLFCDDIQESKYPDQNMAKYDKNIQSQLKKQDVIDIMESVLSGESQWDANVYFESNKDLRLSFQQRNSYFIEVFNEAFQNYIKGEWGLCQNILIKAKEINPNDGPTMTLLNFIGEYGFQAPEGWQGYRELNEK